MRKIILIICVVVLIFSSYMIVDYFYSGVKTQNMYRDISRSYHEDKDNIEFKKINDNIIGWIQIPKTGIDFPVVQGEDNDYYLNHDIKGEQDKHGAIFMDYRVRPDQDKNIIIYGHNMKDGTMFEPLNQFKKQEFWEDHRYIHLDIGGEEYRYQVFSAYVTSGEDTDYLQICFASPQDFVDFFDTMKKRSLFPSQLDFTGNENIITLSTCSYEYKDARLVVHGIRVD